MVQLELEVNVADTIGYLTLVQEEQLPFATAVAINQTAKDIQVANREHLHAVFQLRRVEWAERSVKITHFATKREQWAQIGIHPPGASGDARADILAKFESETQKQSATGGRIAIPVNAKRTKADIVRDSQRPRALLAAGQAFEISTKDPNLQLIVRYVGRGRDRKLETLYLLVPRVRIRPDLQFLPLSQRTFDAHWEANAMTALEQALKTAR